jgi:diguanylate cyclase (GGDEF)-like protein
MQGQVSRITEGPPERLPALDALLASAATELRAAARLLAAHLDDPGGAEAIARLRQVAEALERAGQRPVGPSHRARPAGVVRLLVADDEVDARMVLEQLLEPDYEVIGAGDGQAALEAASAEQPDLILLDLNMPRLDGLQVLERLRADPDTAEIPVILVSARTEPALKARALDLGAVDYLQKPYAVRELRARVERTLRLVRHQAALRAQAHTDALTGLANRRAFSARLGEEFKRARRYHTPLTCVMADLDHLKAINDELGHPAGDQAIAMVAEVLRHELRETDFGARFGGDEFGVLLPHTDAEAGRAYAERVCARLERADLQVDGRRVALRVSLGVACVTQAAGETAEDLVQAADAAMYQAKRAGGGRVVLADQAAPPVRVH